MAIDVPALLARRRPGWSLERPFYVDPAVHDADLRAVWRRSWVFVAHASRVARPGDYVTVEIGGDPLIVIRGDDGAIRALHNVCRHRGSRICLERAGRAKALVCPYHQWTYRADGALAAAREMPDGFDRAAFGLAQARVEVAEGLIFVALSDDAPDFAPVARDLARFVAPSGLADRAKICHTVTARAQANWKLVVENSRECYHCDGAHPEYLAPVPWGRRARSSAEHDERVAAAAAARARWAAQGLAVDGTDFAVGGWYHCGRNALERGWRSWTGDGEPAAPTMGTQQRENWLLGFVTYPNLMLEGGCDYLTTTRFLPLSPTATEVEICWYVRDDAVEGVDYDVARVAALWRATAEQDVALVRDNQAGVNSSAYRPGPYSLAESGVEHFVGWYLRRLAEIERRRHDEPPGRQGAKDAG